jgi:chromosome segregation ATPase
MGNDDLLQQFRELLAENNKQQDENLQKRLEENNKQIRQEIRAEVDPLHERMDTQYKNLSGQINDVKTELKEVKTELSEKIDQQTHDVADILAKAVMPDIDKHKNEIKELQKAVGLNPKP